MARNSVTLTFLGNSRDLERNIDRVELRLAGLNDSIKGIGKGVAFAAIGSSALALMGPLGALTAAVGAFGAIAGTALSKVNDAMEKTGKARQQAIDGLPPALRALVGPIQQLKDSWTRFQVALSPTIASVLKLGTKILGDLLPSFTKLATAGAKVVTAFLKPLDKFITSKTFSSLIDQFAKFAVAAGSLLGPQLVKLLEVFMQLFVKVAPSGLKVLGALLPAIVELATTLTPLVVVIAGIAASVLTWMQNNHLLVPVVIGLAGAIGAVSLAIKVWTAYTNIAKAATKAWTVGQAILNAVMSANPIGLVVLAIAGLIAIIIIVVTHWKFFRSVAVAAWNAVKHAGEDVWNWIKGLAGKIGPIFAMVGKAISAPWVEAFNLIRSAWNNTIGGKGFSIPSWVPVIGGDSFHIPYFHTGGIVGGSGDQLAMLKGGEGVFTRDQMAAMGNRSNRVVIEVTGGGDEFRTWLKKSIRVHGGDPAVLGA